MKIDKYNSNYKNQWDEFIKTSKNSHFFFQRDYMEYHRDRFDDYSLIIFDKNEKIIALLPANKKEGVLFSHQGLTFGGFIINDKMKSETMLEIFNILINHLKENNIKKLVYKCIPYIYHINPSEEDKYALFKNNANLIRRDITTTINLKEKIKYQEQRKRSIKKAIKENIFFEESTSYHEYWEILEDTLKFQHDAKPVHTIDEIKRLILLFPNNIKLFVAKNNNHKILAGTLIYENKNIVHTQYLANSQEGRTKGALDFVIDNLINNIYKDKNYFDFGISNENNGQYLNTGLIAQKEGFGARAVAHDFYELEIK